jgi:hypothetical protein
MAFAWETIGKPIVALAPMAGVTDASYRQLIKRVAPETVVYTEFLSTDAIVYGAERTLNMLSFDPAIERPFIVQVFGPNGTAVLRPAACPTRAMMITPTTTTTNRNHCPYWMMMIWLPAAVAAVVVRLLSPSLPRLSLPYEVRQQTIGPPALVKNTA